MLLMANCFVLDQPLGAIFKSLPGGSADALLPGRRTVFLRWTRLLLHPTVRLHISASPICYTREGYRHPEMSIAGMQQMLHLEARGSRLEMGPFRAVG